MGPVRSPEYSVGNGKRILMGNNSRTQSPKIIEVTIRDEYQQFVATVEYVGTRASRRNRQARF